MPRGGRQAIMQIIALAAYLMSAAPVPAQSPLADHLECYKIKDPHAKASYTADLGGLTPEAGCTIKLPAVTACVPTTKTNVTPPPPGGGPSGKPNAFFCYKVKCPKTTLRALAGTDQFGTRTVTPSKPTILCAPVTPTPPWCTSDAACGSGLGCRSGECACDDISCPNGCCCLPGSSNGCITGFSAPFCVPPSMQTDTECGTGGMQCLPLCFLSGMHCDTMTGTCVP